MKYKKTPKINRKFVNLFAEGDEIFSSNWKTGENFGESGESLNTYSDTNNNGKTNIFGTNEISGGINGITEMSSMINPKKVDPLLGLTPTTAYSIDDLSGIRQQYSSRINEYEDNNTRNKFAGLQGMNKGYKAGKSFGIAGGALGALAGLAFGSQNESNRMGAIESGKIEMRNNLSRLEMSANSSASSQRNAGYFGQNTKGIFKYGGNLMGEGGYVPFSNGVTLFNNGGSHEQNPYDGIQQGVGPNGLPNKVEEGEVKYDNYIYSARLKAGKSLLEKAGLPSNYEGLSFGQIADKISQESKERPNDPISKEGLKTLMGRLKEAQETVKMRKEQNKMAKLGLQIPQQFKCGGKLMGYGGNILGDGLPFGMSLLPQEGEYQTQDVDFRNNYGTPLYSKGEIVNPGRMEDSVTYTYGKEQGAKALNPAIDSYNLTTAPGINRNAGVGNGAQGDDMSRYNEFLKSKSGASWLRYAPVVGAGLGLLMNKPDHSVSGAMAGIKVGDAERIGDYMTYKPLDRNYYINTLNQNNAAIRSAAQNASGGNRGNFMANTLAGNYQYNQGLGNLARQAEEFNLNQRHTVKDFNRGTNMFNAQQGLRSDIYNAGFKQDALRQRASENQAYDQAKSMGMTNLFQGLGDIGYDELNRDMILKNPANDYGIDRQGGTNYKLSAYRDWLKKQEAKEAKKNKKD